MSNASVIRPGLLVSVKSTVVGGVSYQRIDLDASEIACPDCTNGDDDLPIERTACKTCGGSGKVSSADGKEVTRWETKRVIEDKTEHERAVKVRGKALAEIRKECSRTSFGLLCPVDQEGALNAAIAKARRMVDEYNETATHTRVGVYALKGRVASDDAEAARAITQEIGTLVQQMDAGIKTFDPEAIREAANRARELSSMLSDEKRTKLDAAISQARAAARTIVQRVVKESEARETVLLDIQRGQIESARIAFLDMSDSTPTEASPVIDQQRIADLDIAGEAREMDERTATNYESGYRAPTQTETVGDAKARGVVGLEDIEDSAVITRQSMREIEIE